MHHDSLALHPLQSSIPTIGTSIEETGAIDHFPIIAKEGYLEPPSTKESAVNDDEEDVPDLLRPDEDSSMSDSEHDDVEDELDFTDDYTSRMPMKISLLSHYQIRLPTFNDQHVNTSPTPAMHFIPGNTIG